MDSIGFDDMFYQFFKTTYKTKKKELGCVGLVIKKKKGPVTSTFQLGQCTWAYPFFLLFIKGMHLCFFLKKKIITHRLLFVVCWKIEGSFFFFNLKLILDLKNIVNIH